MRSRHQLRIAEPRSHPRRPARGIGPQRVRQLIAAVYQVVPRRKPHAHALAHRVGHAQPVAHRETRHHQREARHRRQGALPCHSVKHQEQAREDQRRSHVPLQKEKHERERHRDRHRQNVFERRNIQMFGQWRQALPRFARVTQHVPPLREIPGQKQHQQQTDDLHRLESQQVHFGVARARSGPEQNQHGGKREAREQRHEAQLPQQPFVIEPAGHRQQQASARHALRETGEQQRIPHRVAQRNHEDQARAREQQRGRQQPLVATEPPQAPPHMHQQERQKERAHPAVEGALKALRPPHHEKRLQLPELIGGQQAANPGERADIREPARSVVDLARGFRSRMRVGDGAKRRQQVFACAQLIEIEQPLGSQTLRGLGQPRRFSLVNQVQPQRHQAARQQQSQQFAAPPTPARAPGLGPSRRRASRHRHLVPVQLS